MRPGRGQISFYLQAILIAMCLIALLGIGFSGHRTSVFAKAPFAQALWATADSEGRTGMAQDLVDHHLRPDMTEQQVLALLGSPHEILTAGRGERVFGARTYTYSLYSRGKSSWDDEYVYIHLDANGRVISAELYGY